MGIYIRSPNVGAMEVNMLISIQHLQTYTLQAFQCHIAHFTRSHTGSYKH